MPLFNVFCFCFCCLFFYEFRNRTWWHCFHSVTSLCSIYCFMVHHKQIIEADIWIEREKKNSKNSLIWIRHCTHRCINWMQPWESCCISWYYALKQISINYVLSSFLQSNRLWHMPFLLKSPTMQKQQVNDRTMVFCFSPEMTNFKHKKLDFVDIERSFGRLILRHCTMYICKNLIGIMSSWNFERDPLYCFLLFLWFDMPFAVHSVVVHLVLICLFMFMLAI